MGKIKSRRLISKTDPPLTNAESTIIDDKIYCRKCMRKRAKVHFYIALDKDLDKNGYMSVCVDCVQDMFDGQMVLTNNSVEKSIYELCKKLNVAYIPQAVDSTKKYITTKEQKTGDSPNAMFGVYKSRLEKFILLNQTVSGIFDYSESNKVVIDEKEELEGEEVTTIEDLAMFWGKGMTRDDYQFLELELANWKQSHKCDTYAELILLREICYVQLDMKNARLSGTDTGLLLKKLLDAMKASALDPAKSNQASSGTGKETWGNFMKNIEDTTPAEYFKDKELFKDFDNIDLYFQNYIRRPAINFYSSTRNLELLETSEEKEDNEDLDVTPLEEEGE